MIGALVSFTLMAIAARELSADYGTFEILFVRSVMGVLVLLAVMSRFGFHHLKPKRVGLHGLRNFIHLFGQAGWFYALGFLPLANVFAIEFTTPIWTAIAAMLFLGEKLTPIRGLAIALGFAGILLILRPGFEIIEPAAFAVLGAAICYALTHICTKKLIADNSALTIIFYMSLFQAPLSLGLALPNWTTPELASLPFFFIVAVTGLTAHLSLTRALEQADATIVIPMDFMRLPLVALVGYLLYGELLEPWLFVGAALILGGIYLNLKGERRRAQGVN